MADIPFAVPDPVGSAAQGLTQGFQLGMQARQASWERKYQKAALAVQISANENVPEGVRVKALNNGLLPILQDSRFGMGKDVEPFTVDSLKDQDLLETMEKMKKIAADKELSPTMQSQFNKQLMVDYYMKKGKSKEAAKLQEEIIGDKTKAEGEGQKLGTDFREQFLKLPEVKDFQTLTSAIGKVQENAKLGTAQGDIALIYGFMKINDPGSTVREGEYATAENSAGIPQRIRVMYNKALTGEKLSKEQRDNFVSSAKTSYKVSLNRYNELKNQYFGENGLVSRAGLDPTKYSVDLTSSGLNTRDDAGAASPTPVPGGSGRQPTTAEEYLQGLPK